MGRTCAIFLWRVAGCLLAGALTVSVSTLSQTQTSDEQAVWNRNQEHFRYDSNNDPKDQDLFYKDHLSWPSGSATPLTKSQIAAAVASRVKQGDKVRFSDHKLAGIQVAGDIAVSYDRNTVERLDKDGKVVDKRVVRFTRTWIKTGDGWQILGGMSMVEANSPAQ